MTAALRTPYCHTEEAFLYCWKSAALSMAPAVLAGADGGVEANCIRLAVILGNCCSWVPWNWSHCGSNSSKTMSWSCFNPPVNCVIQKSYDLQHYGTSRTFHFRSMVSSGLCHSTIHDMFQLPIRKNATINIYYIYMYMDLSENGVDPNYGHFGKLIISQYKPLDFKGHPWVSYLQSHIGLSPFSHLSIVHVPIFTTRTPAILKCPMLFFICSTSVGYWKCGCSVVCVR